MAGSIRQRGKQSWEIRAFAGKDAETGKKRYVTRTVRGERRDAEVALGRLLGEIDDGQHAVRAGTVGELCERWYSHAAPDLSPAVAAEYRRLLDRRILPRWADVPLRRLRTADLDQWYSELRRSGAAGGKPLAPNTVMRSHAVLRRALAQGVKWGWLTVNPAANASPPRSKKQHLELPDPADVARLIEAAAKVNPSLSTYFRLAAATGARRGELCALRRNRRVDASNAAAAFEPVLSGDGVRKVSAAALSRWGQILLLEDDSARAVRRGSTGVAERSVEVVVRAHAIDEHGVRVVGSRSYVPGRSRENGGLLRTDLALELVEQHAASGSVVVCGSSYGAVPAFLQRLCSTDIDAVVEIRPSTRVHVERTGPVQSKQAASGLLDQARWRRVPIGVPGLDAQALLYAATRLGTGSVGNGPPGMLFAALTGAIDGVHRGTVLGFSSDTEASVAELLQAVGWSRWIRPLVRRAERGSSVAASARENRTGANGVRPPLRANIKLSRLHDARAFADATDPDAPLLRGSLRSGDQSINVVELFAGAGGMGLGFLLAETKDSAPAFRLIYSGEVDPIYVRTLSVNHAAYGRLRPGAASLVPPQLSSDDLRDRRTLQRVQSRGQDAGGVDVVIGGPPCQGFSNANRNSWRSDNPHNQLVDVYLTYIRRLQPKVFLLENVQGIHWTPKPASSRDANVLDHVSERMAKAQTSAST